MQQAKPIHRDYIIKYLDREKKQTLQSKEAHTVRVYSATNKTNYADHEYVFLRDPNTKKVFATAPIRYIDIESLSDDLIDFGSSEGIVIDLNKSKTTEIKGIVWHDGSKSLLHQATHSERSFTSTGEKLPYHWPIFAKLQETGYGSILRATLTLHQKCSSKCPYCSTINRSNADCISLDEAKEFVIKLLDEQANYNRNNFKKYNDLYKQIHGSDIQLQSIILSGGGQPNLWPHFTEFVNWLSLNTNLKLGLITNGFPRNIPEETYKSFEWVRVSITPSTASPFYPDGDFSKQYIPHTLLNEREKGSRLGFSYVYGPWTSDGMLKYIDESACKLGFDYVRVLTDCNLSRDSQLESHRLLSVHLRENGLIDNIGSPTSKTFHQLKYHASSEEANDIWEDGQCLLQSYNVFWDTSGHDSQGYSYCYPCDSVTVLTNAVEGSIVQDSTRSFDSTIWGTVKNTEVESLYSNPLKKYFDTREHCQACLFSKNNKQVRNLVNMNDTGRRELSKSINESKYRPEHIEFP